MVEIVSRISKGSKMDQVYIPKNRSGLSVGDYVVVKRVSESAKVKPFYVNVEYLEPIKVYAIERVFELIFNRYEVDNIMIVGSFLEKGFSFDDLDIVIVYEKKVNEKFLKEKIMSELGLDAHLIVIPNKDLMKGLEIDPLFVLMMSRFVSFNRVIYRVKRRFIYKHLDLQLLPSELLVMNWDILAGREKYKHIRNVISIEMFLKNKEINPHTLEQSISKHFGREFSKNLKNNMVEAKEIRKTYNRLYKEVERNIISGYANGKKKKPNN